MRRAPRIWGLLIFLSFLALRVVFGATEGQLTEVERQDQEAEKWQTSILVFGPSGEFYGFSRIGRWTAHWKFPWVASLSELIAPPKARDLDISSPSSWTTDGHGLLIAAFRRERKEADVTYRLLALGLPAMRLLGRADLERPFAEAPKLRFDAARSILEVEGLQRHGATDPSVLVRQTFTPGLQPASSKTTAQHVPVELRKALGEAAFEELKRLTGANRLTDAAAEGWLATYVVDAATDAVTLLVPGETESLAVRLEVGKPGAGLLVRAPRTQRDYVMVDPGGRRMLVEELELRPRPDRGRPANFATGRLVLLDLEAGKPAGSLEDPRLGGFLGGPICMGWTGDAVVAGDHGLFLVRWAPKPQLIQLLPESKRNDWLGCVFTER